MTEDQIKARLSNEARAWTEREERKRLEAESWRRAERHRENIEALCWVGGAVFVLTVLGLIYLAVTK